MTNSNKFSQAATQLLNLRVAGTKAQRLETDIRPITTDDALSVQAEMVVQHPDSIGGWKGLVPLAADKIIAAPIFSKTIQRGPVCELLPDNGMARVEPEIAFILSKDLPAQQEDYTEAQIDDAIEGCYMALELMQDRFDKDCGVEFNERLADCLLNQGMYIGPKIDRELAYAAGTMDIKFSQPENVQTFEGKHPNPLPQNPVYWLINYMGKRGVSFKAGQPIITGSYAGIVNVEFDKQTEIEYAGIGKYTVEFKALS
jgi:2-keto-4-pentenoate hydratase